MMKTVRHDEDSDTTFKVKRSKVKVTRPLCSPPCWRVRRLQRWAWEHVGRGKLLLCIRCRLLGGARRFGAHGGRRGSGHIVAAARLQLVKNCCRCKLPIFVGKRGSVTHFQSLGNTAHFQNALKETLLMTLSDPPEAQFLWRISIIRCYRHHFWL